MSGPAETSYHLWAVVPEAKFPANLYPDGVGLFYNHKVRINTGIDGLGHLAIGTPPTWLTVQLQQIAAGIEQVRQMKGIQEFGANRDIATHKLATVCKQALDLRSRIVASNLDTHSKASILFELDAKINEFQDTFKELLSLDLIAFTTHASKVESSGPRGSSADETPRSVTPGEEFRVRIHTAHAWHGTQLKLSRVWLESRSGEPWKSEKMTGEQ